ncbi:hypothetical protein RUM43_001440 [Polyplax serrata]|uniref:Calcium-activated chloride channel N-terminal domain-containing protein n=1 Tax=Polyplax serrata TaxID=468196 RepID=A0AAN8SES6_POLSC
MPCTALTATSKSLFSSLEGRAYFREISINLPDHWSDSCVDGTVVSSSGEQSDFIVGRSHPVFGDQVWTQQSRRCGEPGDFIYLSEKLLTETNNLGNTLVREWGKYRFGIFDEIGYNNDPVYPQCFYGVNDKPQVTGCSDKPIENVCSSGELIGSYNTSRLVHPDATKSILFSVKEKVTKFCDEKTHDAFAPTKQNLICNRKSAMEVILNHADFKNKHFEVFDGTYTNATPSFKFTRRQLTRYVLVVENTKDMLIRESWSFLRAAIRKWTVHDLPVNTEVGFVLANESSAVKVHDLHLLNGANARDWVASDVPFTPGDSRMPACISCGLKEAIEMLEEAKRTSGPASSVILIISPGTDKVNDLEDMVGRAKRAQIRIATINYPGVLRSHSLEALSLATGALSFTVNERKHNLVNSLLTTYFDLTNALFAITTKYYEGNPDSLPIEIHRRELVDDGRSTITGSFFLEESLGEPAEFVIYTHSIDNPLLGSIQLVSPSQKVYTGRTDSLLQFKLMKVVTNINETGPWTYTIERFRNPQPHFVQVMASPKSPTAPVVRAKFWTNLNSNHLPLVDSRNKRDIPKEFEEVDSQEWTSQTGFPNYLNHPMGRSYESDPIGQESEVVSKTTKGFPDYGNLKMDEDSRLDKMAEFKRSSSYRVTLEDLRKNQELSRNRSPLVRTTAMKPVILYVEVKSGMWPVRGATVEVTITKKTTNDTDRYKERFELHDTGSGDPDLMKGDGIYSKYWSPVNGGKGTYTIDITVTDSGNTAYSWNDGFFIPQNDEPCCGSQMTSPSVRPLSPFQRQLPPYTISFTQEDINSIQAASVGRVADLVVEHIPSELKARLTWTAPDLGGLDAAKYTLHYTPSLETLLSDPQSTPIWRHGTPFPLAAGSETSFTLDFTQERNLLDHPLYFALLAYSSPYESSTPGPLSNYVRVLLSSPPPPPPPPVSTDYSITRWLNKNQHDSEDEIVPRIAQADLRLELILPIVGGILFLIVCLVMYCYFCIVRRRHSGINKGKQTVTSSPEKNKQTSINIISTPTALNLDNKTHSTSSTTSSDTSHSTLQQENSGNMQYDPSEPPVTYQTSEQLHKYGYITDPNQYDEQFIENERRRYSMLQTPEEAYIISQARNIGQQRSPSNMSMPVYNQQPPGYVVSQISNGTTGRIRTLSPFNSWTASQLLHEHERRTSPYGEKTESLDRMDDINRHHGPQFQLPPPVPPLPAGVYSGEPTYTHGLYNESAVRSSVSGIGQSPNYAGYIRGTINPSLQGSLSSVNSSDVRKKRNVTMV